MDDNKCSICKAECEELVVSSNKELQWSEVKSKRLLQDREDADIYYEDTKAKASSMRLRSLQCLMHECQSNQHFPNVESLRRHLETTHQKTFCKICLEGRTVFIREQRIYHLKALRGHIE